MCFVWPFFFYFKCLWRVLVSYLCDKYLWGKIKGETYFISLFQSVVSWFHCCESKTEEHGSVVVEDTYHLAVAARKQTEGPQSKTAPKIHAPVTYFLQLGPSVNVPNIPENQTFNTWAYGKTSQTQIKTEGLSVYILCLIVIPDSDPTYKPVQKKQVEWCLLPSCTSYCLDRTGDKDRWPSISEFSF